MGPFRGEFLITIFTLLNLVVATERDASGKYKYDRFCELKNRRLVKQGVAAVRTQTRTECAFTCAQYVNCLSYNWEHFGGTCELNNATGDPLVTQAGFSHYAPCSMMTSQTTTSAFSCPVGWESDSHNWCLRFYVNPSSPHSSEWEAAQKLCLNVAHPGLACPSTKERYDILMKSLKAHGETIMSWIGLFYNSSILSWQWTNGDPFIFSVWDNATAGDPIHGSCASIQANKGFQVENCQNLRYRICSLE